MLPLRKKSGNCISKYLSKKSELIYNFKTQIVKNGRQPSEVQDKYKISTRYDRCKYKISTRYEQESTIYKQDKKKRKNAKMS